MIWTWCFRKVLVIMTMTLEESAPSQDKETPVHLRKQGFRQVQWMFNFQFVFLEQITVAEDFSAVSVAKILSSVKSSRFDGK